MVQEFGVWVQLSHSGSGSANPDINRVSEHQHAVQHVNSDLHLRRSLSILVSPQLATDHSFPSSVRRLRPGTSGIAGRLLPTHAALRQCT